MDTSVLYGIIGLIHVAGFIALLAVVKLWLKKSISGTKLMGCYIIIFLIGLLIFSISLLITASDSYTKELMLKYPASAIGATIGELVGLGVVFLIADFIILSIGRWIYNKPKKKKQK